MTPEAVISAARRGVPFADIESEIDSLDADKEHKAALWLAAFVEQERARQRRIAEQAFRLARSRAAAAAGPVMPVIID